MGLGELTVVNCGVCSMKRACKEQGVPKWGGYPQKGNQRGQCGPVEE